MSTTPGPRPSLDVRGAVDLSSLGRKATPPPGGSAAPDGLVVDVTEQSFGEVVQRSVEVPVVVVLWAAWSEVSTTLVSELVALATEFGGRFLLARVDAEANPQIAQAFGAQSVPAVVAVLKGQPVPLFQGAANREDVRAVLGQLLEAAKANGVTGTVDVAPVAEETAPAEPPLPPLHQAAYDAIEEGDLDAAAAAFGQALTENPRDEDARAGLAQVGLMQRTVTLDPAATQAAAADEQDLDAQLALADLELMSGLVAEAFDRVLGAVRRSAGPDRDRARVRLLELFSVVGDSDERTLAARRALASALY
ncbi:tetratricopeptide repeat protein [Actinotalea sp.]|uniref:tetratricopeptide repeat protein n=1 Tax=Actinotalea sp. TaxID=1872145 RepID=UPI0035620515